MNRYSQKMKELKATPGGFLVGNGPIHLSEQQLQEAEQELGTRLPEDYREFIRDFGVFGVPTVIFPVRPNLADLEGGSLEIFTGFVPISDRRQVYDVVRSYKRNSESPEVGWSPDWLSIASDAGSGSVVLAIKGENKGAVYYYINTDGNYEGLLIADTFDEFMQLLQSASDEPEAVEEAEHFWSAHQSEF